MILEQETFKKFGYYSKDLKPKSAKRILAKCDDCGKIREVCKYEYRDLCPSCVQRGKIVNEETKQKMSNAKKGKKRNPFSCEHKQKMSESAKERFSNPQNHPSWKGGISSEPYCILFDDEFKERVREYWNRKCMICNKTEEEQMNEMKNNGKRALRLSVHHVTYNKDTCCDDSVPLFVALCISCHNKTNSNREYWENICKEIIFSGNEDGKCFYTKEEMKKEKFE